MNEDTVTTVGGLLAELWYDVSETPPQDAMRLLGERLEPLPEPQAHAAVRIGDTRTLLLLTSGSLYAVTIAAAPAGGKAGVTIDCVPLPERARVSCREHRDTGGGTTVVVRGWAFYIPEGEVLAFETRQRRDETGLSSDETFARALARELGWPAT
jgi:hypothetical protein